MSKSSGVSEQVLSLPKGGGDVRGLGEKFTPDPHTGSGTYAVPIAVPEGRRGLTPSLTLSYSTGAGNGPFGLGWSVAPPAVRRKTDKGIPTYDDELDTFVVSGWEDLVPIGGGEYRPRVDTAFARIRHVRSATEDHWIVVRPDGLRHVYGADASSRVYDESTGRHRVLAWYLSETQDACGNRILYSYKPDRTGDPKHPINQTYLKSVRYAEYGTDASDASGKRWLYQILIDYGDGDGSGWELDGSPLDVAQPPAFLAMAQQALPASTLRTDSFSSFSSGFEVRTRRRAWRISVQARPDGATTYQTIRCYYLSYREAPYSRLSLLSEIRCVGFRPDAADRAPAALPAMRFEYSTFDPETRRYENLTAPCDWLPENSLADPDWELVDLFGNGLPDVLHTSRTGYRYWRNLGRLRLASPPQTMEAYPADVVLSDSGVQFADMEGNGSADLLVTQGGQAGYYRNEFDGKWGTFHGYAEAPSFNLEDPDVRLLDLDGDHVIDALGTSEDHFIYFPNLGRAGWGAPQVIPRIHNLEEFPDVSFSAPDRRVRLADLNGDGFQDIVVVYSGRIDYWPNTGHGHFARRVTMRNSPRFDDPFDPARLFLTDVNGDGLADLVYVDLDRVRLWINQSGNAWSDEVVIHGAPPTVPAAVRVADMRGTGTAGVLWTYDRTIDIPDNFKYLDFTGGTKPHVLTRVDNGMGGVTEIRYAPSTDDYVRDWEHGIPWRTSLPFPVQVVRAIDYRDEVTSDRVVTTFRYHHGFFDGDEREFRGFGHVETIDAAAALPGDTEEPPPSLTRTWFHQGRSFALAGEFHASVPPLPLAVPDDRNAHRALRGHPLRTEVYGPDGTAQESRPYVVTTEAYRVISDGPAWRVERAEVAQHHMERGTEPRVTRNQFAYDSYGNITRIDEIGEGRQAPPPGAPPHRVAQSETLHRATLRTFNVLDRPDPGWSEPYAPGYIVDRLAREQVISVAGGMETLVDESRFFYDGDPFLGLGHPESPALPAGAETVARGLPIGSLDLALTPALETAAWTTDALEVRTSLAAHGAYYQSPDGSRWARLGRRRYGSDGLPDAIRDARGGEQSIVYDAHRLFPITVVDAVGFPTAVEYDLWAGAPKKVTDPNGNVTYYAYDGLGRLTAVAYSGKPLPGGAFEGDAPLLPTTEYVYDFERVPISRLTRNREDRGVAGAVHETYSYFDGFGRLLEERVEAESGLLDPEDPTSPYAGSRWTVTGKQIRNRKGAVRRSYQPYFSGSSAYLIEEAATATSFTRFLYDPLGRLRRTIGADGGVTTVLNNAWEDTHSDPNDNGALAADPAENPEYVRFTTKYPSPPAAHLDTPQVRHFDAFGRLLAVEENSGLDSGGMPQKHVTRYRHDATDSLVEIYDARDPSTPSIRYLHDLLGRQILIDHRTAAGRHIAAHDAAGNQIFQKDARSVVVTTTYDSLQRRLEVRANGTVREVYRYRQWNAADAAARDRNLFGRLETSYDGSGRVDFSYNLRGRISSMARRIWAIADLNGPAPDDPAWAADVAPDADGAAPAAIAARYLKPSDWAPELSSYDSGFRLGYDYDSYDRTKAIHYPDGSRLEVAFNQGSLPETLTLRRADGTVSPLVTGVDYDAFGEAREIRHGNGVTSSYRRDPDNRRLLELRTRRDGGPRYQHLHFDYEPVGNVRRVVDELQDPLTRSNQYIPNSRSYETDPLYRLIRATGRKRGEVCSAPNSHGSHVLPDEWPLGVHAADEARMVGYDHRYAYDAVGNPVRNHDHSPSALLYKAGRIDLFAGDTTIAAAGESPSAGNYRYDACGHLTHSPQIHELTWDHDGCLARVNLLGGGGIRFGYNPDGLRVVKRVQRNGSTRKLTIYVLDKWELTVERRPSFGGTPRWSAATHVWFDDARLATVDQGTFPNRIPILFYHPDQIGSAHVLSREDGSFVGQEEFLPFGRSSDRRTDKNRYRFAGKERDEETGLYYFGGRYYDPVVGRFVSPDPVSLGLAAEVMDDPQQLNAYAYARNNPVSRTDATGYILDTILDVGFIIYDVGALVYDEVANDGRNRTENLVALGADAAGALIPFATGGGLAARASIRGARAIAHTDDAARIVSHADDAARALSHSDDAARAVSHADDAARATSHADEAARATPTRPSSTPPSRPQGGTPGPGPGGGGGGRGGRGGGGGGGSGPPGGGGGGGRGRGIGGTPPPRGGRGFPTRGRGRPRWGDAPGTGGLRGHAQKHGGHGSVPSDPRAYYQQAVNNMNTGQRFRYRHGGQTKHGYVTHLGGDRYLFTGTSRSGSTIFTHMEVTSQYLRNLGITLRP